MSKRKSLKPAAKPPASARHPGKAAARPAPETRTVNLGLLTATVAVVAVITIGIYFLRQHRQSQLSAYLQERAEQLASENDWSKASFYLQRYLQFRTDDFAARMRLVEIAKEMASQGANPEGFTRLLYETIGIAGDGDSADKTRMRTWLAEQLLASGDVAAALREAQKVVKGGDAEYMASALRVAALAGYANVPKRGGLAEAERRGKYAKILPNLFQAIEANPADVTLSVITANLFREHPLLADGEGGDPAAIADGIMDKLVERSSGAADARVARYKYRKLNRLKGALDDLKAALDADPDHYEANLRSGIEANVSRREDSMEAAEGYYRRAIEVRPRAEQAYLLLSQLLRQTGDHDGALEVLDQAITNLPPTAIAARFVQADWLIADSQWERATPLVASLRRQFESQMSRLPAPQRLRLTNRLRLLEARLSVVSGDVVGALSLYKAVALSPAEATDRSVGGVARQANQGAAQLLAGLGHWDQVAEELSQLAGRLWAEIEEDSNDGELQYELLGESEAIREEYRRARIQAAEAYLSAGQAAQARRQLETLARGQEIAGEALEIRLRVELATQLDLVPAKRRWDEFRFFLEEAKQALPTNERVFLAELRFLQVTEADSSSDPHPIQQLLESSTTRFADSAVFWRAAAQAYLALGMLEQADAAGSRFLELESNPALQAEGWVAYLAAAERVDEAREWLLEKIAAAPEDKKAPLKRLEIGLLVYAEQKAEALNKATDLADSDGDKSTQVLVLELAIAQQDWELAEKLEEKLAENKLLPAVVLNFYKALRQVSNYKSLSTKEKAGLQKRIAALRTERPLWRRGASLAARYAEVKGDFERAIEAYELAIALGDRSTETLERLTLHLYRSAQYDRAQQVIDRLYSRDQEVSLGAESLAISTAVKRQKLADAVKLAKQSALDHPEDPARRLWLYNVLAVDGQDEQADLVLVEARRDFADNALIWNAQFSHYLRKKDRPAAERLLAELPPSIASDTLKRSLALAQGYEMLGDFAEAKGHYLAAIDQEPSEPSVRLRYANLLLRSDSAAAQEQLEFALSLDPDNAAVRRNLAALLAADGPNSDWDRINELLSQTAASTDVLDRRLRAVLLTRRGRSIEERASHCELARRILLSVVEDAERAPEDIDRLLLAGAYEQEGILKRDPTYFESARRHLRMLANRSTESSRYKNLYVSYLFRSIDSLAGMEESERIREVFLNDARGRLDQIREDMQSAGDGVGPLRRQALMGLEVRLLRATEQNDEAVDKLNAYADEHVRSESDEAIRARLILGLGALYSLVDAHELAEPWYRELASLAPGARLLLSQSLIRQGKSVDAVNLFLKGSSAADLAPKGAVALAGVLAASRSDSEVFDRAWPAIAGALEQNSDDVELLMSVAVLQVTRGKQDEAIRLFRRVLEISPRHMLALNNLATLLGERESNRDEALAVIGRAIKVAGRKAALLDTQGTIQLQLGDAQAAIASLEESVVSINVDPRYYFHLAAAYLRGGSLEKAREALAEARRRGIDKAVLTNADRELMSELEAKLEETKTAMNKAA